MSSATSPTKPRLRMVHREVFEHAVVITLPDHHLPVVRFAVAFEGGASFDPIGRRGCNTTLGQLMLRGTQKLTREAFDMKLEHLGSSLGCHVGNDLCVMRGVSLAKNLAPTWELLRDALVTPRLDAKELERLIDESVDELHSARDDDDTIADLFLRRALYPDHPYHSAPCGEAPELKQISGDDIQNAFDLQVRAGVGRLIFVFAGDIDHPAAVAHAESVIAALPKATPDDAPPITPPIVAAQHPCITVVDKPERTQAQVRLGCNTLDGCHTDMDALWLAVVGFGGTFTSPLTDAVREQRGWSYIAQAAVSRQSVYPAPLVMATAPAMADAAACVALQYQLYDELRSGQLGSDVIGRAQEYLLNRFPFEVATPTDLLMPALQNERLGLPPERLWELPDILKSLGPQQARQACQSHLGPRALQAVIVATAESLVPQLESQFPDVEVQVVDYRDGLEATLH